MDVNTISLSGEWKFSLDPEKAGITGKYYENELTDKIILPGTTDENKKGFKNEKHETERLTREYIYIGYAWYQKEIEISEAWKNKYILLFLERTRISHVWLDDKYIGTQNSICTPHLYELGRIDPGPHRLTIMVDNSELPVPGSHQTSPDTQTNWNGILGRIELTATDPVWINDINAYPDIRGKKVRLKVQIRNETGKKLSGILRLKANSFNSPDSHNVPEVSYNISLENQTTEIDIEYFIGDNMLLWDEYSPSLYRLYAKLSTTGAEKYISLKEITFAMREFSAKGTQFNINGRTVFLRGKTDCCVFPLTGYAPMDLKSWLEIFQIAKSYGINHYRFHTWCPPEACFTAADMLGIFLQVELPYWGPFYEPGEKDYNENAFYYLYSEARAIIKTFANHPSFVMFSAGNELSGSRRAISELIKTLREYDSRLLYSEGSNSFLWDPKIPDESDFWVTMRTAPGDSMVRGSFSHADKPLGHIQAGPPNTRKTYADSISNIPIPVISHEVGQYQSYPNFREIEKYTGVLKPYNLETFRQRAEKAGILDKADDFHKASGKLAVLCYKEEIEAALRTPGFGGIQLLDLQDFPGQGTALVGILDSFMHSKGFVTPEEWREFCSDIVLLACFDKYTYTTGEEFCAEIKVSNYGAGDIDNTVIEWWIGNGQETYFRGFLEVPEIRQGTVDTAGEIKLNLEGVKAPEKLTLNLKFKNSDIKNHYSIWVYPKKTDITIPSEICVSNNTEEAKSLLKEGKTVLFVVDKNTEIDSVEGFFAPDFWCYPMFRKACEDAGKPVAPGTLGILCNNNHPALKEFPCDYYSDWQWWHIITNSRPVILDKAAPGLNPVVQVIDNFDRNHRLGLLFEGRYKKGKVFVCASDLFSIQDKPEARQLLHSILKYMASEEFNPETVLG
ncbi:glycoside hydrolase family 2 [Thermoclostridium stercorarium subsp. stercorarium DSM 8532]|jgi:hypothetical protein|uniref:Glycoside hydrolase family 2 n=3 Tax=Thermoclostridium stercorarium TaxID=1510 RepID=L7VL47_THES1|nr:glycoside hydrolase family 2 [Thermoclostridium stercorarium]AGC67186.1 glycoside hydrolase family 2 [Thermoclostridium stercorarium subsp. stercorarium DSM 8532]AGI38265.1 beta-galactosidase [Thermoclostridium stercorarium subsp. stercorarium DSM 8532]ANW97658.1 glycoside hydrolase family 2 [Thermoclostridium stercorarium subsp. thermolacticum DSM 2910]ANX00219.1 glycoside hydrolase family 2 [Thermoclostridium stercorarium subsp. leptospartum DSM 9219]